MTKLHTESNDFIDEMNERGGPVYPRDYHFDHRTIENAGILLRDKIAIEAMVAIIAKIPFGNGPRQELQASIDATARGAYAYADAMLKERSL